MTPDTITLASFIIYAIVTLLGGAWFMWKAGTISGDLVRRVKDLEGRRFPDKCDVHSERICQLERRTQQAEDNGRSALDKLAILREEWAGEDVGNETVNR